MRPVPPRRPLAALWLPLLLALPVALGAPASPAPAESELLLPMPERFGSVPASTYDEDGRRVGDAHLVVERLPDGNVRMFAESGIEGAERNVVSAVLAPVGVNGSQSLRLVRQSSRSFDAQGRSLGQMTVDHRDGMGRCARPPREGGDVETLALPDHDRVANIPVNLLFLPLARGEREEIDFQIMLCGGGARLVSASAEVARRVKTEDGLRDIVQISYDMDFGPILSRLARPFMPNLAVWFDPDDPEGWLAHRMPLFAKGPTVMVVRTGVAPRVLEDE